MLCGNCWHIKEPWTYCSLEGLSEVIESSPCSEKDWGYLKPFTTGKKSHKILRLLQDIECYKTQKIHLQGMKLHPSHYLWNKLLELSTYIAVKQITLFSPLILNLYQHFMAFAFGFLSHMLQEACNCFFPHTQLEGVCKNHRSPASAGRSLVRNYVELEHLGQWT